MDIHQRCSQANVGDIVIQYQINTYVKTDTLISVGQRPQYILFYKKCQICTSCVEPQLYKTGLIGSLFFIKN